MKSQVVVGAPLYEMDTDGAASSPAPAASTEAAAPAATPAATATSGHAHDEKHRTPLIKFIGKRDKAQKAPVVHSSPTAPAAKAISTPAPAVAVREGNGVHFTSLKGMGLFGRPALTLKEMEAVESGGATL